MRKLTSRAIRTGTFTNKKADDVITLSPPVEQESYVIILPTYNTATSMYCNYNCAQISQGSASFTLQVIDVTTGKTPASETLAGRYFIVPINP